MKKTKATFHLILYIHLSACWYFDQNYVDLQSIPADKLSIPLVPTCVTRLDSANIIFACYSNKPYLTFYAQQL